MAGQDTLPEQAGYELTLLFLIFLGINVAWEAFVGTGAACLLASFTPLEGLQAHFPSPRPCELCALTPTESCVHSFLLSAVSQVTGIWGSNTRRVLLDRLKEELLDLGIISLVRSRGHDSSREFQGAYTHSCHVVSGEKNLRANQFGLDEAI
jgi:hypothetical protein